jgi:hypothetical protein
MAGASTYTKNNILKALLQGTTMPLPTGTYVSLHTADPGATGANEVSTGAWPAYVRRKAEAAGAMGSGWTTPTTGVSANTNQLTYPSNNGAGNVTVTHFAIWDAATAGNCLETAALATARTLSVGDILVFDVGSLTVTVS